MKKRFIHAMATLYICFAILAAHQAVATPKEPVMGHSDQRVQLDTPRNPIQDCQRLDLVDATPGKHIFREGRDVYQIVAYTASWCEPCQRFKRKQLPALLKSGCKVIVMDVDKDHRPEDITKVPTIIVYYKGGEISRHVGYQTAKSILAVVDKHRGA